MRLFLKSDEDTFVLTKTTLTYMKAVAVETMKEARILYKSQENLGAIQRTSSKTRQTDPKVSFAKDPAKDNTVPSAPFQEDLEDKNDKPPKYEAIQKGSEPFQNMMQAPGSFIYNQPVQQFPPYGWPQQIGAFQNPGYAMNTLDMEGDWIETQISNTKNLLRNRGFPLSLIHI